MTNNPQNKSVFTEYNLVAIFKKLHKDKDAVAVELYEHYDKKNRFFFMLESLILAYFAATYFNHGKYYLAIAAIILGLISLVFAWNWLNNLQSCNDQKFRDHLIKNNFFDFPKKESK